MCSHCSQCSRCFLASGGGSDAVQPAAGLESLVRQGVQLAPWSVVLDLVRQAMQGAAGAWIGPDLLKKKESGSSSVAWGFLLTPPPPRKCPHKTGINRTVLTGPGARLLPTPSSWACQEKNPKTRARENLANCPVLRPGRPKIHTPPGVVTRMDAVPRPGSRLRDRQAAGGGDAQARRRGAGRAGHRTAHPRGQAGRSVRSSGKCVRGVLLLAQMLREPHPHPARSMTYDLNFHVVPSLSLLKRREHWERGNTRHYFLLNQCLE